MIPFSDVMHSDMYDTIDSYMYEGDGLYPFSDQDQWGWDGPLTPVPGFGFFPKRVNDELDHMTQVSHFVKMRSIIFLIMIKNLLPTC